MVRLVTSDGAEFEVPAEAAMLSGAIRRRMELGDSSVLSLDVDSRALVKVIEYCNMHAFAPSETSDATGADLNQWDADFVRDMDQELVSLLLSASKELDIKGLLLLSFAKKILILRTKDHEEFAVEAPVAMRLRFIKDRLGMDPMAANRPIFLPCVSAAGLSPVIEYCRKHSWAQKEALSKHAIQKMDARFVRENLRDLFDLIRAASYLQANNLVKLAVEALRGVAEFADLPSEMITSMIVGLQYTRRQEKAMVAQLL